MEDTDSNSPIFLKSCTYCNSTGLQQVDQNLFFCPTCGQYTDGNEPNIEDINIFADKMELETAGATPEFIELITKLYAKKDVSSAQIEMVKDAEIERLSKERQKLEEFNKLSAEEQLFARMDKMKIHGLKRPVKRQVKRTKRSPLLMLKKKSIKKGGYTQLQDDDLERQFSDLQISRIGKTSPQKKIMKIKLSKKKR